MLNTTPATPDTAPAKQRKSALRNRRTAIIAASAIAMLAGGAAFAYPPGTDLTVSATVASDPAHPGTIDVKVTVMNANPTCDTRIRLDDGSEVVIPKGGTTGTTDFYVPISTSGRHRVSARTLSCGKGQKEHAKSRFLITGNAAATASGPAEVGKNYRIDISGLPEGTVVTAMGSKPGSGDTATGTSPAADRRGTATVRIKFPSGDPNWSVSFSSASPSGVSIPPITVTVVP